MRYLHTEWNIDEMGLPPENESMWNALEKEQYNDTAIVNRPEDPRIQAVSASDDTKKMARLTEVIQNFVRREYDEELDASAFNDLSRIGIAETNAEDREDIVIDVCVNVPDLALDMYVNGDKLDSWYYSSLYALIHELDVISFDELVSPGPRSEARISQLMHQFPLEHDFLRNPEDGYAIYQLRGGHAYHELRYASLNELQNEAGRFRKEIHAAAEKLEDTVMDSKEQAEGLLRGFGMTVVPNDDPTRITLENNCGMRGEIYLRYGVNCCHVDGCDTRALDQPVNHENYHMVYSDALDTASYDPDGILENLYAMFNIDRPSDFTGHSMSVSDVVVLRQEGMLTAYYCDSFGFQKLPNFLSQFEYLRSAEMAMEDDLNMIDGIINNGPKDEKPSLRAQLTELSAQEQPHNHDRKPKEIER